MPIQLKGKIAACTLVLLTSGMITSCVSPVHYPSDPDTMCTQTYRILSNLENDVLLAKGQKSYLDIRKSLSILDDHLKSIVTTAQSTKYTWQYCGYSFVAEFKDDILISWQIQNENIVEERKK